MPNFKITTVVVAKNLVELEKLVSKLKPFEELSIVGTATTGNQGMSLITNFVPELVFVNVDLQDVNGLEFVRILQSRNIFPKIIFIAGDSQLAYESMTLRPFDFFVDPIGQDLIRQMLARLKMMLKKKELIRKMDIFANSYSVAAKRIFKQKGRVVVVLLEEIVYCKAELTTVTLMLKCGEELHLTTGISETLETINCEDFIRIGRSYFINRNFLRKIDRRNLKCQLYFEGTIWEVSISKNTISQLEKLNVYPIY